MGRSRGIPVVMYHSIVPERILWGRISDSLEEFEKILASISERGFTTVFLKDLYNWMSGRSSLPDKPILLTFDDGYLDNWLYVYPLLKKYGHRATLFPALEFIREGELRSLDDFSIPSETLGYLNWSEVIEMYRTGVFDLQSHTMTHTWHFSSADLIDLLVPSSSYNWLEWNRDRSLKPQWKPCRIEPGLIPGYPLFTSDRALGVRRFIPHEDYIARVLSSVKEQGGTELLSSPVRRRKLLAILNSVPTHKKGRFESEGEFRERVDYELGASREILSGRLGKPVEFLCWPGGGRHISLADSWKSYGYLASSIPSNSRTRLTNLQGDSPEYFSRIASGLGEWRLRGKPVCRLPSDYSMAIIDKYLGVPFSFQRMRMIKLGLFFKHRLLRSG